MVKKKIIFPVVIIASAGLIIILLLLNLKYKIDDTVKDDIDLNLYVHFDDPVRLKSIREELKLFTNLESQFRIDLYYLPFSKLDKQFRQGNLEFPADILVSSAPYSYDEGSFITKPVPWTGQIWTLYYNKDALKSIGIDPENGNDAISLGFSRGGISRKVLEDTFHRLYEAGIIPITLGAQYGWPLAAWIQHLTAFEGGIEEAKEMLSDSFDITSSSTWKALQSFSSFVKRGWVWKEYLNSDWPSALRPLIDGEAAFCLLSENLATSLPVNSRKDIGFIPFPQSAEDKNSSWRVGSLIYLGVPSTTKYPEDTLKVLKFLTSSGTTARLSKNLFIPFFDTDWSEDKKDDSVISVIETIPSITSRTDSPVIRNMKKRLIELTEIQN